MDSLPFVLKVPGKDEMTVASAESTSFKFHGFLYLEADALRLEWTGIARVERVSLIDVEEETLPLPDESLLLPFDRIREISLRWSWLMPHIEIRGSDLEALRIVPSEERGRLRLWIARRDRAHANKIVELARALR
jgi:hypothetical protein